MTASKQSLRLKRLARGLEARAHAAANSVAPWRRAEFRTWQRLMCEHLSKRNAILRAYLTGRSQRRNVPMRTMRDLDRVMGW